MTGMPTRIQVQLDSLTGNEMLCVSVCFVYVHEYICIVLFIHASIW